MTTARDTIVDALDIESFVLCKREQEAKELIGSSCNRSASRGTSSTRWISTAPARIFACAPTRTNPATLTPG